MKNGAGSGVSKGTKVHISDFCRAFKVETEKCPVCGQFSVLNGVKKEELTLCDPNEPVQNAPIKETPKELSLMKRRNNELQNEVQKLKRQILDMENQLSKWKGKYARAVTNDILKI